MHLDGLALEDDLLPIISNFFFFLENLRFLMHTESLYHSHDCTLTCIHTPHHMHGHIHA